MRDEGEDRRRVGRDEMNLCEFPIASLADRVSPGCKTLVFEDQHGRLTVMRWVLETYREMAVGLEPTTVKWRWVLP